MSVHPTDEEIVNATTLRPIAEIASKLGLADDEWAPYGRDVAKISGARVAARRAGNPDGRLVLVSAITPTPAGEGKTTTSIGLAQALALREQNVCLALREPSLGPVMGVKGGGTGGGRSQIAPPDRINLHLTGDLHAITSAHNLLAALIDNHLQHGNALDIDVRQITWRRVIDMNDRSLRNVTVGLGGKPNGVPRETGFDITAASEVMATLCMASDADDLRDRLASTVVAMSRSGEPIRAGQLDAAGPMLALLKDALDPNLVQTLEGVPCLVHGGPFANIAHGCNSVIATRTAMSMADWTVTEGGFGFDLGAEKFLDLKCRTAGIWPSALVLVATIRALKMHGGVAKKELGKTDADAVARGIGNLAHHVEAAGRFGLKPIVALNHFASDHDDEVAVVRKAAEELGVPLTLARHHAEGGAGAVELADLVMELSAGTQPEARHAYELSDPLEEKIAKIARQVYGADGVTFTREAKIDMKRLVREGAEGLPICMAKTQSSISDDPKAPGRPRGFTVTVRALRANHGAGFVVALTGDIMRMPGLPREPMSRHIDLVDGAIVGIQ